MNTATAVKVITTPSIAQSRAEIFALFDACSHGGLVWGDFPKSTRVILCRAAGLKQRHVSLPLNRFSEFDRAQLLRSIKSLSSVLAEIRTLSNFSLQEFK